MLYLVVLPVEVRCVFELRLRSRYEHPSSRRRDSSPTSDSNAQRCHEVFWDLKGAWHVLNTWMYISDGGYSSVPMPCELQHCIRAYPPN